MCLHIDGVGARLDDAKPAAIAPLRILQPPHRCQRRIAVAGPSTRRGRNHSRRKYTKTAPPVRPNMAILITKKARWYQEMTEMILVSMICSISVAAVTMPRAA